MVNSVYKQFINSLRKLFMKRHFLDSGKQLFTILLTVFISKGMAASHGEKKSNWGSRRRTTTVPGARMSPLRACPMPLGGKWRGPWEALSEAIMEPGCVHLTKEISHIAIATRGSIRQQQHYVIVTIFPKFDVYICIVQRCI